MLKGYEKILDSSNLPSFIVDNRLEILYANGPSSDLLGVSLLELKNQSIEKYFP